MSTPAATFVARRRELLDDRSRSGRAWCEAHTGLVDAWLADLLAVALGDHGEPAGTAIVAVGGYGRRELCPASDLDVLLLHDGRRDIAEVAERLWYPIWDTGLKLGHAVRTTREALQLAGADLDTATALLDARLVAGDAALAAQLAERAAAQWRSRAKRWLSELAAGTEERHAKHGEVAFLLEPDLKEARGGLRDLHALAWAEAARRVLLPGDLGTLAGAHDALLAARVELHRTTGRAGDRLLLQDHDAVAEALGDDDAFAMVQRLAASARAVAWTSDDTWQRIRATLAGPRGRISRRDRPLAPGVVLRDGRVRLADGVEPAADPVLVLRVAAAAAHAGARIERPSLDRLVAEAAPLPDPWPEGARQELVSLLGAGPAAIPVFETLDHHRLLSLVLPEWDAVRSRPQRNAYHRFTVDRHLCETAANAAALARQVARPDLLLVGAWLHDLGKGYPGDHTRAGMDLMARLAPRMGFPPDDVAVLLALVEHHLLLADVATRRDLDDDATIEGVAGALGSRTVLELLHALTEADSLATGPSAWSPWKAGLVRQLVARVDHVLGGGEAGEVTADSPVTPELEALVRARQVAIRGVGRELVVVAPDRPGLFSRVAGTLALHGLDVLAAAAWSSEDGMAVETFRVEPTLADEPDWDRVSADLGRALSGRLSIDARLAQRASAYGAPLGGATAALGPAAPRVLVDNDATVSATVVEVRAPSTLGVLYRITRALAALDLDIRHAKVQTLGHEVVDAFYVVDGEGRKVSDPEHLAEMEAAILHELGRT